MAVSVIGDIHFDDSRPWSIKVAQKVIEGIVNSPLNISENTLVLLGDLTERSSISGTVYSMLMSLFVQLKYKEVYILVGNHDGKLNMFGKPVLVYDFIRSKALKDRLFKNFTIVSEPKEITLEGMDFLFLPHIFNDGRRSLKDYERNLTKHWNIDVTKKYTSVFGHFTSTFLDVPGEKIDVSYLKSDFYCFGHIHNPTDHYQGSYVPNSIAEAGKIRQVRVYENGKQFIVDAPYILEYSAVKFPDPLPSSGADITVWTVHNCKDEEVARDHYGDVFIRRCIYDIAMDNEDFDKLAKALAGDDEEGVSIEAMFDEWVAFSKLTPELKEKAKQYLTLSLNKKEVA
jgi:predicted phosphodiesterase